MYKVGVDLSNTGCIAITEGNIVIDVIKYPIEEFDKIRVKNLDKEIKELKDEPRTATKIKILKAERSKIKRRSVRNYKILYDFLLKYRDKIDIVNLEEPILQTASFTTAQTIASNFKTLGVYLAILSILELDYKLYNPQEWHQQFKFSIPKGLKLAERRKIIKEQSIQFSKELFINIDDFLIRDKCRKEDDNIAESTLLSILK